MKCVITAKSQSVSAGIARVSIRVEIPDMGGLSISNILVRNIWGKPSVTMPLYHINGVRHPSVIVRGELKQKIFEAAINAAKQSSPQGI